MWIEMDVEDGESQVTSIASACASLEDMLVCSEDESAGASTAAAGIGIVRQPVWGEEMVDKGTSPHCYVAAPLSSKEIGTGDGSIIALTMISTGSACTSPPGNLEKGMSGLGLLVTKEVAVGEDDAPVPLPLPPPPVPPNPCKRNHFCLHITLAHKKTMCKGSNYNHQNERGALQPNNSFPPPRAHPQRVSGTGHFTHSLPIPPPTNNNTIPSEASSPSSP